MPIDHIEIRGYKSIRELDLELGALNILIGANGAGKSNFLTMFSLSNALAHQRLQLFVGAAGGADTLLHYGHQTTEAIEGKLTIANHYYGIALAPDDHDRLYFVDEYVGDSGGTVESIGRGHHEALAPDAILLSWLTDVIASWQVYHFMDTSRSAKIRKTGSIYDNEALQPDGANLAAMLYRLRETTPNTYQRILNTIQLVLPSLADFVLRPFPLNPDSIRLEWHDRHSPRIHGTAALSDGTLRFMCLATLLLQPDLPSTILIDEPELGLHPYAISVLAGMLKAAATRTQVIVSTQSVPLVNQFSHEDIIVVDHQEGQSTFRRLQAAEVEAWLDEYGIGDIWEKNIIGGRPHP